MPRRVPKLAGLPELGHIKLLSDCWNSLKPTQSFDVTILCPSRAQIKLKCEPKMGGGSEFPDHDITKSVSNGSSTASSTTALPLRIITYNIRYAATSLVPHEEAWKKRLPNIQRELYHYSSLPFNPSTTIVCLQEVLHEQLNDLARALNDDSDLDDHA